MLPSSFRGEGVEEAHTSAQNAEDATQDTSQRPRTIMMRNPLDVPIMTDVIGFQDSYDALLPSTSQDPHHLIGFQADPERQEQQKKQELAERQAAKAPIDLRDVLNRKERSKIEQLVQKKRARDLANSDATNSSPNPSPVQQPEPRQCDSLMSSYRRQRHDSLTLLPETRCVCSEKRNQRIQTQDWMCRNSKQLPVKETQRMWRTSKKQRSECIT